MKRLKKRERLLHSTDLLVGSFLTGEEIPQLLLMGCIFSGKFGKPTSQKAGFYRPNNAGFEHHRSMQLAKCRKQEAFSAENPFLMLVTIHLTSGVI